MTGGASADSGYLFCDGTAYSKTGYSALFTKIGTTFGSSSTTFNVPNLQQRFPMGKGSSDNIGDTGGSFTQTPTGTIATSSTFSGSSFTPSGSITISGSVANHTLTIAQMPSHNHPRGTASQVGYTDDLGGGGLEGYLGGDQAVSNVNANMTTQGGDQPHNHGFSGSGSFSGSAVTPSGAVSSTSTLTASVMDITNPYVALNYQIKY